MSAKRAPCWIVSKFDVYQDDDGQWKIHLDGRKKVGTARLPHSFSDEKALHELRHARLIEIPANPEPGYIWIDWLSPSAFNIMAGERPLYQVVEGY